MKIAISCSMKLIDGIDLLANDLRKMEFEVKTPTRTDYVPGDSNFRKQLIDEHLEKIKDCDALLLGNIGGRVGASTYSEAGWAYALGKKIFAIEKLDPNSDYYEDLHAIGVIELNGDLTKLKENL